MRQRSESLVSRVTVSGSFRRHMGTIYEVVRDFVELGAEVLSPADPRIVDTIDEFVFVASDRVRSIKMVQDRHLECIRASDFLWIVAPDGYVGQSASMEIGYAVANQVPVFCQNRLTDVTLDKYVRRVSSIGAALPLAHAARYVTSDKTFLVNPAGAIEHAHYRLDRLRDLLAKPTDEIREVEGHVILEERSRLATLLAPRPHVTRA